MGGRGSSSSQAVARTMGRVDGKAVRSALSGIATGITVDRDGTVNATLREGGQLGLTVSGDSVKVDGLYAASTGAGAGTRALAGVEAAARALGAKELRLTAGQVGTYAWAKYPGMTWTPATGHHMESAYRGWLKANGHSESAANGTSSSPHAMATSKHGKAFLLSDSAPNWNGTKTLR